MLRDPQILLPLIINIFGLLSRIIIFGITMSFLEDFRKYSSTYEAGCTEDGDTYCAMYVEGEKQTTNTKCSVFNFGDRNPENIGEGDIKFPVSEFNQFLVWTGAIIYMFIFCGRLLFDIIWSIRRIDQNILIIADFVDILRGVVSYWYITLDVFVIMWMFPLYSYKFDKVCLRSLDNGGDGGDSMDSMDSMDSNNSYKDLDESSDGYTISLFLFSILLQPLIFIMYKKLFTNSPKMTRISLITSGVTNFVFMVVSTHRAWVGRWAVYRTLGAFLFFMWIIYAAEIACFWIGYYTPRVGDNEEEEGGNIQNIKNIKKSKEILEEPESKKVEINKVAPEINKVTPEEFDNEAPERADTAEP